MRKFKLLTDGEYVGCNQGDIFYECEKISDTGRTVKYYQEMYPEDWKEVFDESKPLHKETDLGYFSGLAMQALLTDPNFPIASLAETAVKQAQELIKQLDAESK